MSLTHFLTDTLFLGKEAIYRRIRGDVAFSFYEIYLIAQKLKITLDYIVNPGSEHNIVFELRQQQYYDIKEDDYDVFNRFIRILNEITNEPISELAVSYNVFPQIPMQLFYNLGRYNSFKWIYQNQTLYPVKPFEEVEYPQELYQMHRNTILDTTKIKKTTYIWDTTIFEAIVREIKYFESIELIKKEDVLKLKEELHEFLAYIENLAKKGEFDNGNIFDLYISCIDSDTAYCYIETPRIKLSLIGAFALNHVVSSDERALAKLKGKILSRKRVATLISRSDEMYRISFFRKQHNLIDTL